jgi:hypothetical protein
MKTAQSAGQSPDLSAVAVLTATIAAAQSYFHRWHLKSIDDAGILAIVYSIHGEKFRSGLNSGNGHRP